MRSKLFNSEIPDEAGTLADHELRIDAGFLFASFKRGIEVQGRVLYLSGSQLRIADQWEEVPMYSRAWASVVVGGGVIEAWVYVRPGEIGWPAPRGVISMLPRKMILDLIADFRDNH